MNMDTDVEDCVSVCVLVYVCLCMCVFVCDTLLWWVLRCVCLHLLTFSSALRVCLCVVSRIETDKKSKL